MTFSPSARPSVSPPVLHRRRVPVGLLLAAAACAGGDDGTRPVPPATHSAAAPHTASRHTGTLPVEDPVTLARDGFVWGFPLVVSTRTMAGMNDGVPNEIAFVPRLADETSRDVVLPSRDVLYAPSTLDLRAEPQVLRLEAPADGRYFSWQLLDPYTEAFAYVGTRATGGRSGVWVVTPPGWVGDLPPEAEELRAPTPQLVLLGRYAVRDEADAAAVYAQRDSVVLEPLSRYLGTPSPPGPAPFDPPRGEPRHAGLEPLPFWDELGDALARNPPATDEERALADRLLALGVGPGLHPSTDLDADAQAALIAGAEQGLLDLQGGPPGEPWTFDLGLGRYGTDWLRRARIARSGWGANVAEEAVYATARADAAGRALDGATTCRLAFAAGALPPTGAFWSVTLYGADGFLVGNPLDRFALGSQTPGLAFEPDGGLVLAASAAPPAEPRNWLPAPQGPYQLVLRVYLPGDAILDGAWAPPPITCDP